MSWRKCCVINCPNHLREGLRRSGDGVDGQPLADGRTCWQCRRKQATPESRQAAKKRIEERFTRINRREGIR